MPTIIILDFLKDPRWDFHFWYHPHLQQDVVAPVSTRASTSTPAMETLTTINWDALPNAGATNVPIWPLWHPLAPSGTSGTIWHPLAPSGTIWHPLAPSGTLWHHLAPSGTIWHPLAPSGTLWHPLAPSGTSGTVWHPLVFQLPRSSSLILSNPVPLNCRTLPQNVAFFATTSTPTPASNGIPRSLAFIS